MNEKINPESLDDVRLIRLLHLDGWTLEVTCACGRATAFPQGMLQRRHRLAGTTLVADLQFILRCQKCNRRDGFRIEITEERERGRPGEKRITIVTGRAY